MRMLLHRDKLDTFKLWLDCQGIEWRPGSAKNPYELMMVRVGKHWLGVYDRIDKPIHLTIDGRLEPTVRTFIKSTNRPAPYRPHVVIVAGYYMVRRPPKRLKGMDAEILRATMEWCEERNKQARWAR